MPQTIIQNSANLNRWDVKQGHSPLSELAKSIYPQLSESTIQFIDEHSFHHSIRKGSHLLKEGNTCQYLFFIVKGAFRSYIKEDSKEVTTWITLENQMITSIKGLYSEQPSNENIQAIEDSILIGATYKDLNYLYEHYPDFNIVGRKLLENYCDDADMRGFIGRIPKATTRYNYFMATNGNMVNRIPLKYIASYLGIRLETLSRIRSKLDNL